MPPIDINGVRNLKELDDFFSILDLRSKENFFYIKDSNHTITYSRIINKIKEIIHNTRENDLKNKSDLSELNDILNRRFFKINICSSFCQQLTDTFTSRQIRSKSTGNCSTTNQLRTIQSLPSEIIVNILSFLNDGDKKKATSTSHFLMDVSKRQELLTTKLFIEFLAKNVVVFAGSLNSAQKKELNEFNYVIQGLNSHNLLTVEFLLRIRSAEELRKKIIDILKYLNETTLLNLEELSKKEANPDFFNIIFDLVEIYKKIDVVETIYNPPEKRSTLINIFEALIKKDDIIKAIEVASSLTGAWRSFSFQDLAKALVKEGHINEAINVFIKMIDMNIEAARFSNTERKHLHDNISKILRYKIEDFNNYNNEETTKLFGKIRDKVIEVAKMIPHEQMRSVVLFSIYS